MEKDQSMSNTPFWSFADRELEMSKNINHKNPEIAICEIAT
jgi:hypothetical protein